MNDAEKLLAESQFLRAYKDPVLQALNKQIMESDDTETEDKLIKLLSFYCRLSYTELIKSIPV